MPELYISVDEHKSRMERLRDEVQRQGYDAFFTMNPRNLFWLTGFSYIPVERPLGLLIPVEGDPSVVLFRIEELHWLERVPWIRDMTVYLDYPGPSPGESLHSYEVVSNFIRDHGIVGGKRLAVDGLGMVNHAPRPMDVFRTPYGHGPSIRPHLERALAGVEIVDKSEILAEWMLILSQAEQQLVREGARWGFLAHRIMYEMVSPGRTPFEVCLEASREASLRMVEELGPDYEPVAGRGRWGAWPVGVHFQAGKGSAYPHGGHKAAMFRTVAMGDVCKSAGYGNVGGSLGEIERTFFVGKPTERLARYWKIIRKAQNALYEAIKPGAICSEACKAEYEVFLREGVWDAVCHHAGHNKVRRGHDPPYLDPGDHTIIKPGMCFTLEPGLYFGDIGGFGLSDTCIVTEDGAEWVTDQLLTLDENIV